MWFGSPSRFEKASPRPLPSVPRSSPSLDAHIGEGTVAVVAIENVGGAVVERGMTVGTHPGLGVPAPDFFFHRQIVDDIEIEIAVAVGIEEAGRGPPGPVADSGRFGHVLERRVAAIAQQGVAADVADVEVGIAVAVVVAPGYSHAVAAVLAAAVLSADEMSGRGLEEESVSDVAVVGVGALHEVEVEPVVAVEIDDRDAGPHVLAHPLLTDSEVSVAEVDSELRRGIAEQRRLVGAGCGADRPEHQQEEGDGNRSQGSHGGSFRASTTTVRSDARSPAGRRPRRCAPPVRAHRRRRAGAPERRRPLRSPSRTRGSPQRAGPDDSG